MSLHSPEVSDQKSAPPLAAAASLIEHETEEGWPSERTALPRRSRAGLQPRRPLFSEGLAASGKEAWPGTHLKFERHCKVKKLLYQ